MATQDWLDTSRQSNKGQPGQGTVSPIEAVPFVFSEGADGSPSFSREPEALGLDSYRTSITVSEDERRIKDLRHRVLTTCRMIQQQVETLRRQGIKTRFWMVGFTYRPGETWRARDLSQVLYCARAWLERRYPGFPFIYCWVAEIQPHRAERRPNECALHYHLVVVLPLGVTPPKPDKQGWWTHGCTRREPVGNPFGYMAKYLSKGGFLDRVPKGARLSGFGGLSLEHRIERAWWMLPAWVRQKWDKTHRVVRAQGGGYLSRLTGEVIASRWVFAGVAWVVGVKLLFLVPKPG